MTMKGEPVPAEGLDHIKALEKWLEQYPNDVMVRSHSALAIACCDEHHIAYVIIGLAHHFQPLGNRMPKG